MPQKKFFRVAARPIFISVVEGLEDRRLLSGATVTTVAPLNGATNVSRDAAVTADFFFPNASLDFTTVNSNNVMLFRSSDQAPVAAIVNTTGGDDAIVLQPTAPLDANTNYTFDITSGVHDTTGTPVVPFSMTFTTGTVGGTIDTSVSFQQVALPVTQGVPFTTVRVGPDHDLWAGAEDGRIFRYPINADGTLGTPQVITSLQDANGGPVLLTGFTFDPSSTASNPIPWVSNGWYGFNNAPDFSSKITRMSGPNLQTVQDVVVGLPRSVHDHLTNQPTFGPDGALYFSQGAENSMGAPDTAWGLRPEHLLSSAILRLDVTKVTPGNPINVQTAADGGTYDPTAPGAALTVYAYGVRNAFQLLWTSDGHLYAPTNGASAGGNTPAGNGAPALNSVAQVESDYLYNIIPGEYYGHPNPAQGHYVLDGGNPTAGVDPEEITAYPVGTQPDQGYQQPVFDFGLHRSPDGIIEYTGNAFNGALNGKLLVPEYSAGDDIVVLTRDASGNIVSSERHIQGLNGFTNPVNLAEDPTTGDIYVAELGGQKITLLQVPANMVPPPPPPGTVNPIDLGVYLGHTVRQSGVLSPQANVTSYTFTVQQSARMHFALSALRDKTELDLLDANGKVLRSFQRKRGSGSVSMLLGAGVYYLKVTLLGSKGSHFNLAVSGNLIKPKPPKAHHGGHSRASRLFLEQPISRVANNAEAQL